MSEEILLKTKELQNAFINFGKATAKQQKLLADFTSACDTLKYHFPGIDIVVRFPEKSRWQKFWEKILKLLPLVFLLLFFSCVIDNTQTTQDWINSHPKPITVTKGGGNELGHRYVLVDSTGNTLIIERVRAVLPDTIKAIQP